MEGCTKFLCDHRFRGFVVTNQLPEELYSIPDIEDLAINSTITGNTRTTSKYAAGTSMRVHEDFIVNHAKAPAKLWLSVLEFIH